MDDMHSKELHEIDNSILTIPQIIGCLHELSKHKNFVYYHGTATEYTFSFRDRCTLYEIEEFEKNIGYLLPTDYKQFLSYTNGLSLSTSAVSWLLSIQSISEINKEFGLYPHSILVIGQFFDGDVHALIDLESLDEKCMYIFDVYSDEFLQKMNCNFTEFLNRFITSYGVNFWEWGAIPSSIKIKK